MNLPESYLKRMKELLGNSYEEFLLCYEEAPVKGLRFNTSKVRTETVEKLISEWNLEPVPWCPTGFYYKDVRPGLSPYHDSGIFYMQEPSAMSVIEEAELNINDRVLDLCAAPGGKSTAASEKCKVILSNEIIPQRARILSSNIERMGVSNACVCSASPERLSDLFPEYFDVVIADAPCTGEGMMRKDETAVMEWTEENVDLCVNRQEMILDHASLMVRTGGKLVYSTCTFELAENEDQISAFLGRHPEFMIVSMKRIWPHKAKGEGHFVCVLSKGEPVPSVVTDPADTEKTLKQIENRLNRSGVHILRTGIQKGEWFTDKKGQKIYEPSHAEIMASVFEGCTNGVNLRREEQALEFMSGNVLRLTEKDAEIKGADGYTGIYYDGYPLGLGKRSGNTVKNHLPKGLRRV